MRKKKSRQGRDHSQSVSPNTQAATLTLSQLFARWDAWQTEQGRKVTPIDAIKQCAWVYTAVTFIAEHIMRTPQYTYAAGTQKRIENGELQSLIENPNEYSDQNTSSKFRYAYFFELLLNGSVMRVFGEMNGFKPKKMSVRPRWHYKPKVVYDEFGREVPVSWTLRARQNAPTPTYTPGDGIYHDALYNPVHDFEGLSPLAAAMLSITNDIELVEFANRFFRKDGSTGVIFSTDDERFGQAQCDAAVQKWEAQSAGDHFGAKFLGFGLKPHSVGTALDARMFQVLRNFSREEIIAGIYKIPLDAISAKDGGGDIVIGGPSGGTQASSREAFLINVVQPWAMRYDDDFNRDVTWRFEGNLEARHDFSQNPILERRRLERAIAAVQLVDRGVPLNEVIRMMRLDIAEQSWGNDWWVQNDRLPARVVLGAGDDAIKIAIPEQQAETMESRRKAAADQHFDLIASRASSIEFAERVRSVIRNNGVHNS